ncbi:oligoribonuclease [Candidatus Saccharibacteria bacterium]|nr:oligoribonuclease [Candidatus Saccharibacteria bacterium]
MDKALVNARQDNLLWVDLEMTGLDPTEDRILEVAALVTDWKFQEVARYEAVVKVGPRLVERRMRKGPSAAFWDTIPETRDALITQNETEGRSGRTVENELLAFLDAHFVAGTPVILAGNSIHMDRRFIQNEWPRLDARLHYRMLDVSAWKVVFEHVYKTKFAKREAHRALDDIKGSIEELQYYLKRVKK